MSVEWDTSTARRLGVVVPLALVFTLLSLEEIPPPDQPTEMWAAGAVTFVWMTVVWDGRSRPRPALGLHLLAQLAIFWAAAVAFGWSTGDAAWMGVTNVLGGLLMLVGYARLRGDGGWAPATATANLALLGLAGASGALVALLGGYPNLGLVDLDRLTVWWIVRHTVYAYVGGVTMLGLLFARGRWTGARTPRWVVALLFPLGAVCLWITYLDPGLPLTWFLLLPAVLAGTLLTVRGAALYALYVAVGGALATLHPINQFGYTGFLPGSLIIDLLLTASTFVTIHLAILRDQRAGAIDALEAQRRAAQEQATMLESVFESMSEGLVMLDRDREAVLHNAAARQLVGRRIPVGEPVDWIRYFDLRHPDGGPVGDLGLLGEGVDGPGFNGQLLLGEPGRERVVEVRAWPLPGREDRTMVLFSDVTAARERLSELTGFAGVVAHDLRSPLASLHGWLEMAEDALAGGDPGEAAGFLGRAQLNSHRMRQVIEDWLAYTVNRDGLLTRSQVRLDNLLAEIVAPYTAVDEETAPTFELDAAHTVEADRVLTRQLLANLIGNAVKYTREGERPHVRVSSTADDEAGFVRVDVCDRGIGLPTGEEERIFEEFHRAQAHAGSFTGTGLGLSLCRRIVQRHGGRIEARNNAEGGATFSFTLPAS